MIKFDISFESIFLKHSVKVTMALPYPGLLNQPGSKIWCLHPALKDGDFFFNEIGVGALVDKHNCIFIAPSLGNTFFIDTDFARSESFLQGELMPFVQNILSASNHDDYENICLGISMGAYGSLHWALTDSKMFNKVILISGVFNERLSLDDFNGLNLEEKNLLKYIMPVHRSIFNSTKKSFKTLTSLIDNFDNSSICFDIRCGSDDHVSLDSSRQLLALLQRKEAHVEYHEARGGMHDTSTWREIVFDSLV